MPRQLRTGSDQAITATTWAIPAESVQPSKGQIAAMAELPPNETVLRNVADAVVNLRCMLEFMKQNPQKYAQQIPQVQQQIAQL